MGVFTDNMQALNRGFVSERAEKKALQKKKNSYKNYLYNTFYNRFYRKKGTNPKNTFAYLQQFETMQKIVNDEDFATLDVSTRIELYNSILNKSYKQFKNDYELNISTEEIEKEEEKELHRLLKIYNNNQKIIARQEAQLRKVKQQQHYQLLRCKKEISKGFSKIGLGLIIGGRVASKTYKKMKY